MWREPRHRSGVITNSHERSGTRVRKRRLLIFSARIFDSSVERGVPSRAAAPDGPNTRPPVARTASSMSAFSCEASAPDIPSRLSTAGRVDIQLSSTVNSSVSDTITDRSMTFCSSRTFPGHGYDLKRLSVRLLTRRIVFTEPMRTLGDRVELPLRRGAVAGRTLEIDGNRGVRPSRFAIQSRPAARAIGGCRRGALSRALRPRPVAATQ